MSDTINETKLAACSPLTDSVPRNEASGVPEDDVDTGAIDPVIPKAGEPEITDTAGLEAPDLLDPAALKPAHDVDTIQPLLLGDDDASSAPEVGGDGGYTGATGYTGYNAPTPATDSTSTPACPPPEPGLEGDTIGNILPAVVVGVALGLGAELGAGVIVDVASAIVADKVADSILDAAAGSK